MINLSGLQNYASSFERITFVSGCFDLLHPGHIFFLEEAKKYGDYLFVMVGTDSEVAKAKGAGRPIIPEKARLYQVQSIKYVDRAFLTPTDAQGNKYEVLEQVIRALGAHTYVVSNDLPLDDMRERINKLAYMTNFVIKPRFYPPWIGQHSTTSIVEKVVANYGPKKTR